MSEQLAVIGHPVSHSMSPTIHSAAFKHLGIAAEYDMLDVAPEQVPQLVRGMQEALMRQYAVTIPNKEIALQSADFSSEIAAYIGAANTLTRMPDGRVRADNTDWVGVRDALLATSNWEGKRALVIGAGGAARGTVHALQTLGMQVSIRNRTREKAEDLIRHFDILWGEEDGEYDLIFNATDLGMRKEAEPWKRDVSPFDTTFLHREVVVFDSVTSPLLTKLIREAQDKGCKTIDGFRMLVYQGIEQLRIWTDVVDPVLSQKVVASKEQLAHLMRKAAMEKLGL